MQDRPALPFMNQLKNKDIVEFVEKTLKKWKDKTLTSDESMEVIEAIVDPTEVSRRDVQKFRELLRKVV